MMKSKSWMKNAKLNNFTCSNNFSLTKNKSKLVMNKISPVQHGARWCGSPWHSGVRGRPDQLTCSALLPWQPPRLSRLPSMARWKDGALHRGSTLDGRGVGSVALGSTLEGRGVGRVTYGVSPLEQRVWECCIRGVAYGAYSRGQMRRRVLHRGSCLEGLPLKPQGQGVWGS